MINGRLGNRELDITRGLTGKEVRQSRERYGENKIKKKKRKSLFMRFLESFGDPVIKILLVALLINAILLFRQSNWFESIGIAVAILLATIVSTLSEYGNESAFEKLQEEASRISCRVKRHDGIKELPMSQIVVGDIVLLQAGDKVPADGSLITGKLEVDQSSLNGESKEAAKHPSNNASKKEGEKIDFLEPALLFSGTTVCSGEGYMRVTGVGDNTVFGRIGAEIQKTTRSSPLKFRLTELASGIGKFSYIAAIFTALTYLINVIVLDNKFVPELMLQMVTTPGIILGHIIKAITLSVTVIVMAVPEGLPMMITVVLSSNMKRMLKDNVLVRKLTGIETAGSLSVLFTDKTGTLTCGKPQVMHYISGSGRVWDKANEKDIPEKLQGLLRDSLYFNCAASMSDGAAVGGNATDRAALEFASRLKDRGSALTKHGVVAFSSDRKFMATAVSGSYNATFIKGAPEKILPYCTGYYGDDGLVLCDFQRAKMDNAIQNMAQKAIRVVAVAVSESAVSENGDFRNLKLIGLLGIRDEIRKEVTGGLSLMTSAGIQTVMITGDSHLTALAIAREIGLVKSESDIVITSEELNAMSDKALRDIMPNLRVVARALPSDKSRLVRIAQNMGDVVGMTGDGVNDAPALKQADIGFAMGSGTEVAKEAGDIVILNDNFNSITKAVCYGRTVFKNIRKFVIYQMSICMCAVGVTVIAPLIGVDFPITVIQMLWINIVMDTLAGIAFSGEIARKKYMFEPPKPRNEPIISSSMKWQIAVNSIYTCLLCLFFLKSPTMRGLFGANGKIYKLTAFFALFMFSAIVVSFCSRTHQINLLDYLSANKPFLWIMGTVTAIQVLIIYFGGTVFRTVGLEIRHLMLIVSLSFTIVPVDALRKLFSKRNAL